VQRIAWILLVLITLGWVGTELPGPMPAGSAPPATVWRRTRAGWEHQDRVLPPAPPHRPSLHPVLIATFEVLLTATAMLAVSRN
jgi:hypothetical protein